MKTWLQKFKTHCFSIDLMLFIILGQIILLNALPTALQLPNHIINESPEQLSIEHSTPLNEFYIQGNGKFQIFNSPFLNNSPARMEYWGENHLLIPVYRAVKTGIHLSNLGYNEGYDIKERSDKNPMIYKSLFISTWNNAPQLLYSLFPQNLRHIQTLEQELEVSKIVRKFRYILAYIHLIGMILFFIVLYKRLGRMYAWAYAVVLILNPGVFFSAGNLYDFILMPLFLMSYAVYFYPIVIENYTHKKMILFTVGFTIISGVHNIFGSLYYHIYTWAPVIATMFFMELCVLYNRWKKNKSEMLIALFYAVLRISFVTIVSIIPLIVIYWIESQEMVRLYGIEIFDLMKARSEKNFLGTIYIGGEYQKITTLREFLIHLKYYYISILNGLSTIPELWIEHFMPKLVPFIPYPLLGLKVKKLLFLFFIFIIYHSYKLKQKIIETDIMLFFAMICFFSWTLGLNLVSTVAAYHQHISSYVYSTYLDIIIALFVVKILLIYKQNKV